MYICNAKHVAELRPLLRRQLPDTAVVIGGPEVTGPVPGGVVAIIGEGDLAFAELCRDLLNGNEPPPVLRPPPPDLAALQLPYDEYTDTDLAHRLLYVESSRGCAMRCDYCVICQRHGCALFSLAALFLRSINCSPVALGNSSFATAHSISTSSRRCHPDILP